jgi:hypothetical protein
MGLLPRLVADTFSTSAVVLYNARARLAVHGDPRKRARVWITTRPSRVRRRVLCLHDHLFSFSPLSLRHSAQRRFWSLAVIMNLTVVPRQTLSMSTPGDSSAIRRMCAELWLVVFEEVITAFDTWGRVCRRNKRVIPLLLVCKGWKVNVRPHRYIDKTLTVPGM